MLIESVFCILLPVIRLTVSCKRQMAHVIDVSILWIEFERVFLFKEWLRCNS
jgi:hypothetical protein